MIIFQFLLQGLQFFFHFLKILEHKDSKKYHVHMETNLSRDSVSIIHLILRFQD